MSSFSPITYAIADYDRSSESLNEVMELYGKEFRDVKNACYVSDSEQEGISSYSRLSQANQSTSVRLTFDDNLVIELVDDVVESVSKDDELHSIN